MATHDKPILGAMTAPDATGKVYWAPIEVASGGIPTATLGQTLCAVMEAPATAGDCGFYGSFVVPQNYVGTPVIVIRGILEDNTNVISFGIQQTGGIADNETAAVAYEAEDIIAGGAGIDATGYSDDDLLVATIALTPGSAYAAGDTVYYFFYRDDTDDTQTTDFYLTGLDFRYSDA